MRLTRIGGPTVLAELDGWRILLDPTFDPPGRTYAFGLGTSSVKTLGPAVPLDELGPVDVALVSHDHHADNLDDAGRALLPSVPHVLTTVPGAARLGLPQARGLAPGDTVVLPGQDGRPDLHVTATPCRHGPPLSRPLVGHAVGFAVRRAGEDRVALWASGDTVLHRGLTSVAARLDVDVAVVNVGGVRFGRTGPIRYTLDGRDAVRLLSVLRPRVAAFAHYDGWSHFLDGEAGLRSALTSGPAEIRAATRWLPAGEPVDVSGQHRSGEQARGP